MAAYTSADYLASIRRALESAMVQLGETGFDAPQFTDRAIYYSIPDAVDDVNAAWETSYEATATATSIAISPEVMNPEKPQYLEELVLKTVNEALAKSQKAAAKQLRGLTGGLKIPGLF